MLEVCARCCLTKVCGSVWCKQHGREMGVNMFEVQMCYVSWRKAKYMYGLRVSGMNVQGHISNGN